MLWLQGHGPGTKDVAFTRRDWDLRDRPLWLRDQLRLDYMFNRKVTVEAWHLRP